MTELYITPKFELKIAAGDPYSQARNMTVRINNSLVQTLNSCVNMPKIITFILEGDISKQFTNKKDDDVFTIMEIYLEHMMKDIHKNLTEFRELLPPHSKREHWPTVIWLIPSLHRNYKPTDRYHRRVLADAMEKEVKNYPNFVSLRLKQIWDENNLDLFNKHTNKFTADGLTKFWQAVDRTIKYCDVIMNKKELNAENPAFNPFKYRNPQYIKQNQRNSGQETTEENRDKNRNIPRHGEAKMETQSRHTTFGRTTEPIRQRSSTQGVSNIRKRLFWQRD